MVFIAASEASIFYEVSYSNDNSLLLSLSNENILITDGRYIEEANAIAKNCQVVEARDTIKKAIQILKNERVKKIFIDPSEWTILDLDRLGSLIRVEKRKGLLTNKRAIKTEEEIEKLKLSASMGAKAFESFANFLRTDGIGKSEFELNWKAKEILSNSGKNALSFEPITAIDANSSLPHARVTSKSLESGSMLLFDAGVKIEGYCSDRTRTGFLGKSFDFDYIQKANSQQLQSIYDTVLKAHDEAIRCAKPGMRACDLDKIAREIIENAGFGDKFVHSLGHGVGIEIHEYPTISAKSKTVIEEGMVFTIEPGIYIEGLGGVRIEDMVVMRKDGVEVL